VRPFIPSATWTVLARRASSALQGIGSPQRPVHLEGRVVVLVAAADGVADPLRHHLRRQHLQEEGRRAAVGEDCAPSLEAAPVGRERRASAPAPHLNTLDRRLADHFAAPISQPLHQRPGDFAGAALRDRVAVLLAEPAEEPAEHAAAGALWRQVGVEGVAGDQPAAALAPEALLRHPPRRQQREAGEVGEAARTEDAQHPGRGADRRQRRQQGADQVRPGAAPEVEEPAPGIAVAGGEGVERGAGLLQVHREQGAAAVGVRMSDDAAGAEPVDAVAL
jgi:hypothetical protein